MRWSRWLGLLVLAAAGCSRREAGSTEARAGAFSERLNERSRLVAAIAEGGVKDAAVLQALRTVPRHAFVPDAWAEQAYADRPLPIGHGQTISQPSVVAAMTEAAHPAPGDDCLEIGTGSGYQAAVLAELCSRVFSIEYLAPLARQAERALRAAGYGPERLALRTGDGYVGWPDAAPFEVILVTAAPERVPEPLLDQLAVGGRLVIPIGARDERQYLELYQRHAPGKGDAAFEKRTLMAVRFVPFVGEAAGGR